ncbi:alpha-ketoglutarate-dependent dioxygenase AlkB [Paraglaciecola aquimarina]|uniref:Alpha-ketoglutarate-dependent dioxygenase AlkB n=1 Tax=Paraglaciecola algarum TaxID=3050085 RepID=A0ABS9D7Y7_9ALTE|nr:alpha-ketoglutarate-dependent dioxygenase AlkB [Paraglaciecola sp. G1-23]MCF2949063.1 alpha-ketoglutarate-dependent dioxygenase AlkB [Paraglaciecola sp. G1-23]
MQQSLFDSDYDNTPIILHMPDADVVYYPNFIPPPRASELMVILQQTILWKKDQITLYGKIFNVPRLQAWYGDDDAAYEYSGLTMQPQTWTKELLELKKICEQTTKTQFNSVLANLYRNGADGVGRHADDEKELGQNPVIASLSFGETRNLDFYHNHSTQKLRLPLESGSLLVMKGGTQANWQHGVAKSKKVLGPRVNLTFRSIKKNSDF